MLLHLGCQCDQRERCLFLSYRQLGYNGRHNHRHNFRYNLATSNLILASPTGCIGGSAAWMKERRLGCGSGSVVRTSGSLRKTSRSVWPAPVRWCVRSRRATVSPPNRWPNSWPSLSTSLLTSVLLLFSLLREG